MSSCGDSLDSPAKALLRMISRAFSVKEKERVPIDAFRASFG